MDNSDVQNKRMEWMRCDDRMDDLYINGVKEFLDFAFGALATSSDIGEGDKKVPCPCKRCNNSRHKTRDEIYSDLLINGIVRGYVRWIYHGEYKPQQKRRRTDLGDGKDDDIFRMIYETRGVSNIDLDERFDDEEQILEADISDHSKGTKEGRMLENLLRDAQQTLYPGCEEYSKLSFILNLFQVKCMDGMTNKAFTNMLKIFNKALPKGVDLPSNYYEARKMITDLGFDYQKIEACENDCMLFWKENTNLEKCSICDTKRNKASPKVLRYFPLQPRLQRLFMSSKTASDMRWHFDKRQDDGVLKHPADGEAWKHFDKQYPSFASDSRNVRLGLASDGFNPFGGLRSDYSIWPVVLVVYNLPPWMCMKQPYTILSLLIPGKSGPRNNIDVYLQPLIEDLKELWESGINTFDASNNEYFQMHASLLWTINDFPAYANLSGWSTKGYKACPCCMSETSSLRLPNHGKCCYMDHRRFLPTDHEWRESKSFNGKVERRGIPKQLSGAEILDQVEELKNMKFGKSVKLAKRDDNWKKRSIFFELPYWSSLLLRHNLDVMHIEKNVFDNILGTLLDIEGKSKDNIKARHDLKCVNIMKHLAPRFINGKWHIPPAPYTLSRTQKEKVCKFLDDIKVPDGYSSNISKCINLDKRKIWGLKTHDCHALMEQLLPLAIRGVSIPKVYDVIVKVSAFFKDLCSKTLKVKDLEALERQIVVTLCEMEKIFLPSFFDVMVHLCVHLAAEAKLGGPVQYRWMYPIERNKSRAEGSIAESYIIEECMFFCSKYLHDIETRFNQPDRNTDKKDNDYQGLSVFAPRGTPLGKAKLRSLGDEKLTQVRKYVLMNCDEAQEYINEYEDGMFDKNLVEWFQDRVRDLPDEGIDDHVVTDLRTLSLGPLKGVRSFNGYVGNGFRFHTRDTERKRVNQNSGVLVRGFSRAREVDYFGVLTDIIEAQYLDGKRVVLFRCDWWDVQKVGKGVKFDKHGFISVNSRRLLRTQEPFVLLSQAQQVFYVRDGFDSNWLVVLKTHPRHHYNISEKEMIEEDGDALQQTQPRTSHSVVVSPTDAEEIHGPIIGVRDDIDDMIIDATEENKPKDFAGNQEDCFDDDDDPIDEGDTESDNDSGQDSDNDIDLA